MSFNVKKCNIIRITRSKTPFTKLYTLGGQILDQVDQSKYLGITITEELDWAVHINSVTSRANSTLGFLRRNLRSCPQNLKELAYMALVRSKLEYGATTWDPYEDGDVRKLDSVRRKAARFVYNDYGRRSSVTSMLKELGWQDLATRRKDLRLALLYKVIHGAIAVPADDILTPVQTRTRAASSNNYRTIRASTDAYKYSFFPRTIRDWNTLSPDIREAPSLESFKARLHPSAASSRRNTSFELVAASCP